MAMSNTLIAYYSIFKNNKEDLIDDTNKHTHNYKCNNLKNYKDKYNKLDEIKDDKNIENNINNLKDK